jgi:UDP-N-acetylmuramate--alanine ligase
MVYIRWDKYENTSYVKTFHFVGVGGSGMSSLAHILLKQGFKVSGCDLNYSETINKLEKEGLEFLGEHDKSHVENSDVIVFSSAVPKDNPEIIEAKRKRKIILKRIELLAEILKFRYTIAVIGSHGKTTTTTLISHTLEKGGKNPLAIIGGVAKNGEKVNIDSNIAVVEVDESDNDFPKIIPYATVITNIDKEHLEKWGGYEGLKKAILKFAKSVPIWGFVVVNIDDPGVKEIVNKIPRKVIRCSVETKREVEFYAENIKLGQKPCFDIAIKIGEIEGKIENIKLGIPGLHNVSNSLLAFATSYLLGVQPEKIKEAFESFEGVKRRIDIVFRKNGVCVIDDYAHHPTEIKATLKTIRENFKGKIFLIFEPHRFSRVYMLKNEFAEALKIADESIITDIYPASEQNTYRISAQDIVNLINSNESEKKSVYVPLDSVVENAEKLFQKANEGDVIVFMGAGKIKNALSDFLKSKNV